MNVLVDCGAHTGDSLPLLIKSFGPFDRVVCFEANPQLVVANPSASGTRFEVLRSAVWNEDTQLRFYFGEHPLESSLMENKSTGNFSQERSTMVNAVDFANWIYRQTADNDQLTVKMDIEGAEFDVLERLASHPARSRVKVLLVEWHNNRLRPRWRYRLRRRMLELRYLLGGTPIRAWGKRSVAALKQRHGL